MSAIELMALLKIGYTYVKFDCKNSDFHTNTSIKTCRSQLASPQFSEIYSICEVEICRSDLLKTPGVVYVVEEMHVGAK